MKVKTGIWLDKRKAIVVKLIGKDSQVSTIDSNIETYNPKGGSRSKEPYGPMMNIKEKGYREREKHQSKIFFENIIEFISESDQIFICGPADMKNEFRKYLIVKPAFKAEIVGVEARDSMTENQIIADIKAIFKEN
jgi:hypothetical protein